MHSNSLRRYYFDSDKLNCGALMMQKVAVEVKGGTGRSITVPIPDDLPAGKYAAVLVPVEASAETGVTDAKASDDQWTEKQARAWERLSKEVEQLQPAPQPVQNEYHKGLIEQYRKQGLNL